MRLIAAELGARLEYAWQPFGRGFVRKSLGSGACDVLVGVPAGLERVLTTRPYYRSGYVFVNERGHPFGRMGIGHMIERAGEAAGLPFPVHVHMLRHSTG